MMKNDEKKIQTRSARKDQNGGSGGARVPLDIPDMLRARMNTFSPSEQNLAGYILDHIHILPFETGGSIAQAVGVSEMTVTRFVRGLGFKSLRELKNHLRASVLEKDSEIDDYMARFQVGNIRQEALKDSLRLELESIVKAYGLTGTKTWNDASSALAKIRTVYVVGFQASKGLAIDFASRLLWVRPNVIFVESASGTFGEIIASDPRHSMVVMVDTAAYATRALKLAEKLKALGIPLIIVTDKFSHWAFEYTDFVFEAHTHVKTFWDSTASLGVILNLLIDTIAIRLGLEAKKNFATMSDMGKLFGEFVGGSYLRRKD
jgi:DNA-binding MurR/RpiR family transcriptional regulator